MNPTHEKSRARALAKERRSRAVSSEAGIKLIRHFPASRFQRRVMAGFWPIYDEINVRPLMQAWHDQGERLALPRTPRKGKPLSFHHWEPNIRLTRGPYGTREPSRDAEIVVPDIILVPLLAFTARGERLGYGGGFYDRTLAQLRLNRSVYALGVAYSAQEVDSVPLDPYDQALDGILTPDYFKDF